MDKTPLKHRRPVPATTRRVLRALSLFTGVQAVGIVVSVIRTKLVALWVGQTGIGLLSLYARAVEILTTSTQFDIRNSSVRDISSAENSEKKNRTAALVRRLGLILGIGGAVLTVILSPVLSTVTFGDSSHTTAFIALAVILPLSASTAVESALMQGYDRLRNLARSTLYGAIAGTACALPLYYFFRIDAIVSVLIIFAFTNCLFARIYGVRIGPFPRLGMRTVLREGRGILKLGASLTISNLANLLSIYALMVFLNRLYGEGTVGIFNAGSTMLNTYVGILFTAISMEFYPRLSKVCRSAMRTRTVVSHEALMSLCILLPVIVAVICCSRLIIQIFYADSFVDADSFVSTGIAGMIFRAPAWCMAFCMIARGDARTYLFTECTSAVIYFTLSTVLFKIFGFAGLGSAYVLWYVIYFAIVYYVYRCHYCLTLARSVWVLMGVAAASAVITTVLKAIAGPWTALTIALPMTSAAAFIYFRRR